eukprot:TRINITY_DN45363_c0_g1_i1.p1 TRINITY_DN45363_c0_g1~~TRINITY_DN45363_c0_g1_i1.p1  ORF type:complete len:219 (-),score=48.52 TRINITY_DN45363_c0_g1_i1:375-968(-)
MLLLGFCALEAGVPWAFCGGKRPVHGVSTSNKLVMRRSQPLASAEDYMNEAKAAGYSMEDVVIGEDTVGSVDFLPAGMQGFTFEWVGTFLAITIAIAFAIFISTPLIDKYVMGKEEKYDFKTSRIGRILAGEDPMSIPQPEDSLGFYKGSIDGLLEQRRQNLDPLTWAARPDLRPKEESEQGQADVTPSKEQGKEEK